MDQRGYRGGIPRLPLVPLPDATSSAFSRRWLAWNPPWLERNVRIQLVLRLSGRCRRYRSGRVRRPMAGNVQWSNSSPRLPALAHRPPLVKQQGIVGRAGVTIPEQGTSKLRWAVSRYRSSACPTSRSSFFGFSMTFPVCTQFYPHLRRWSRSRKSAGSLEYPDDRRKEVAAVLRETNAARRSSEATEQKHRSSCQRRRRGRERTASRPLRRPGVRVLQGAERHTNRRRTHRIRRRCRADFLDGDRGPRSRRSAPRLLVPRGQADRVSSWPPTERPDFPSGR